MSNGQNGRLTKNERREQAREESKRAREAAKRKERTGKVLLQGGIILVVVAAVAVIALIIVNSVGPKGPGPKNMASGGVVFEQGSNGEGMQVARTAGLADGAERVETSSGAEIHIQAFVDFLCPICGRFEKGITPAEFQASGFPGTAADFVGNSAYIQTLVEQGVASFEVVPLAILDRASLGTKYSTRAANAFACVADKEPDAVFDFMGALFDEQPAEGTSGLDDNELISLARGVGVSSAETELCIRNQDFKGFITDNTNTATSRAEFGNLINDPAFQGVGTPMVYVNGQRFTPQFDWSHTPSLRTFIQELQGEAFQESQPVPTPTATPAP